MGCHTRYLVPVVHGIEPIKQLARHNLNSGRWYVSPSHRQMFEYAIDNDLEEPILEVACKHYDDGYTWSGTEGEWILYKEANKVTLEEYNRVHGTHYSWHSPAVENLGLEHYGDEPRIGGYPERVVRSYEDMVDFMTTGFTKENGDHCNFYYPPERYDHIMAMIRRFFNNYHNGIIVFG